MAQNITLLGASYADVPAVELPKTGGGTASFTDVTDTTATAADVAQGKYFYDSAGVRTEGAASGGGSIGGLANMVETNNAEYAVQFGLSQLKKGQSVGGTVVFSSAFPNTEQLMLSTGLSVLHGIIFAELNQDMTTSLGNYQTNKWLALLFYNTDRYLCAGLSVNNATSIRVNQVSGTNYQSAPINGNLRISGGDIYYTGRYNKNANYQILRPNQTIEWLAW